MRKRSSKYSGYQNVQYSRSKPADNDEKASTFLNINSPRKDINKPIEWQVEVPPQNAPRDSEKHKLTRITSVEPAEGDFSKRSKRHSSNKEESKNQSNKLTTNTKLLSSSDSSCKQILLILFSKWRRKISHREK